jgi:hypothetical protein
VRAFVLGEVLLKSLEQVSTPRTMKKADRKKFAQYLREDKLLSQIPAIPAVLYFPPEVLGQLNELCSMRQLTVHQLMTEALKSQETRFDQLIDEVMTPLKPGESTAWPEDPLYCLACVMLLQWMRLFVKMMEDPAGFEQIKSDAPLEWSFRSPESDDEEPADWWKEDEPQ